MPFNYKNNQNGLKFFQMAMTDLLLLFLFFFSFNQNKNKLE